MKKILISTVLLLLLSCKDSQDQISETAKNNSQVNAQDQVEANYQNERLKSQEMENDLAARHRFFQAVKGSYEGKFETTQGFFKIRIELFPTLSPYKFENHREFRRIEEVIYDINNLAFNVRVMQWNPSNSLSVVSCKVEGLRPDIMSGSLTIAHSSCSSLYLLKILNQIDENYQVTTANIVLARKLLNGEEDEVNMLIGEIRPSTNAVIYNFEASKIVEE